MTTILTRYRRFGPALLVASAVLVGLAIALDGAGARGINGVAGIGWIVSAMLLLRAASAESEDRKILAVAVAVGLLLVLLIKPSDLAWAVPGFMVGGVVVALAASRHRVRAALLLPALWLPLHLLVAILKVIVRALRDQPANVRTDPPPTAALVPLAMVLSAMIGGLLVERMRERRQSLAVGRLAAD